MSERRRRRPARVSVTLENVLFGALVESGLHVTAFDLDAVAERCAIAVRAAFLTDVAPSCPACGATTLMLCEGCGEAFYTKEQSRAHSEAYRAGTLVTRFIHSDFDNLKRLATERGDEQKDATVSESGPPGHPERAP